jgi:hypothetical protein
MDSITKLSKENMGQLVLIIFFIIYLIMGYRTPEPLAELIDTLLGKIVVIGLAIYLLTITHPVLGVLGVFVAFDLIRRSSMTTGNHALDKYLPTERKKVTEMTAMNQFPYTLEQEVVKKMAPIHKYESVMDNPTYTPILENQYDAASIMDSGILQ